MVDRAIRHRDVLRDKQVQAIVRFALGGEKVATRTHDLRKHWHMEPAPEQLATGGGKERLAWPRDHDRRVREFHRMGLGELPQFRPVRCDRLRCEFLRCASPAPPENPYVGGRPEPVSQDRRSRGRAQRILERSFARFPGDPDFHIYFVGGAGWNSQLFAGDLNG
jgi:hypothetical protein